MRTKLFYEISNLGKNYYFDKQNYVVEIAPNVDAAFMIGLGIIFDELKNESD